MVVTRRHALVLGGGVLGAALAGCTDPSPGVIDAHLTIGLTYVPNVQFAPFYVAQQRDYFTDAGVEVTLRHHGEAEDLFGALTAGREQVVVAGGDEILQARAQDVDVVSIATMYQQYPVTLIVPAESDISSPADLVGRTVGIPGPFGETYFGLLAMLDGAGLTSDDVTVEHIGFTQQAALSGRHVDAVVGFVNNDIPQFRSTGLAVEPVSIGDVPLVGIGLGTTSRTVASQPDALAGVVEAVGRAVADIAADPEVAVEAAVEEIPGTVDDEQQEIMSAVAQATVPLYGDLAQPWGRHDASRWEAMAQALPALGITSTAVGADGAYTDEFIASAD